MDFAIHENLLCHRLFSRTLRFSMPRFHVPHAISHSFYEDLTKNRALHLTLDVKHVAIYIVIYDTVF